MPEISLPKAVFWDWDGTLVDSYGFLSDAHNHTLQTLGFPAFQEGEYKQYFGKPRDILYPLIYKNKSHEAIDIFQEYVLKNNHKIQTIENAITALDFFYKRNIPMGIVSNKRSGLIKKELKHHKWEHYFKTVIGAGDAIEDKPSGAPLELAIKQINLTVNSADIWYVGDTENDLLCAKNVGCKALFLEGHENSDILKSSYKPLITFFGYLELKEFLVAI